MLAQPKLSAASKMPCRSWSLPAWETCPGAKDAHGDAVEACKHCYALQGRYLFGAVKAVRDHNKKDWKNPDWVEAMIQLIGKAKYFRWFDSGDIYTPELAEKIYKVVCGTPNCRHWIPTRAYKDSSILPYLEKLNSLPNCVVRYSSDSVHGKRVEALYSSVIIQSADDFQPEKGYSLCRAFTRKGKCGKCRACWDKRVSVVAYPIHGHKAKIPVTV